MTSILLCTTIMIVFLLICGTLGQLIQKRHEKKTIRGYAWFKWQENKITEAYNAFDPTLYNSEVGDR